MARILEQVVEAVRAWPEVAADCGVPAQTLTHIAKTHRLAW